MPPPFGGPAPRPPGPAGVRPPRVARGAAGGAAAARPSGANPAPLGGTVPRAAGPVGGGPLPERGLPGWGRGVPGWGGVAGRGAFVAGWGDIPVSRWGAAVRGAVGAVGGRQFGGDAIVIAVRRGAVGGFAGGAGGRRGVANHCTNKLINSNHYIQTIEFKPLFSNHYIQAIYFKPLISKPLNWKFFHRIRISTSNSLFHWTGSL